MTEPRQPNTLGKASLLLGVMSSFLVFSIGLCAGVGKEQGWLQYVGALLFVLAGSSAFLGLLGAVLGFFGLWGRNRARGTALVGLLLGVFAVLLFLAILNAAK